jgi:hypothetical protein
MITKLATLAPFRKPLRRPGPAPPPGLRTTKPGWVPKGGDRGTGPKGLADECMAKGYEIKVVPAKDPAVAKDVYLPNRKPK